MNLFQNAVDRVKEAANGFLTGRQGIPKRDTYYASEEEAMAYGQGPQMPAQDYHPEMAYYQQQGQPPQGYQQQPQQPYPPQPMYQPQQPPQQPRYRTQAGYQEAPPQAQQPYPPQPSQGAEGNFAYFPGAVFQGSAGESYVHVERVSHMLSREDVHTVVQFMMNKESIIVNCESIGSAQEVQRCIDLMSGAAYALNCQLTQLSLASKIFLISPSTVSVLCDEASHRMNGRNGDGTPLRSRGQGAPRQRARQQNNAEGYGYPQRAEYQEYQPEYDDMPQAQPYQPVREGYGRPTYQSAAM